MGETIWVGTLHNIKRTYVPFNLVNKLECARFSAYLKIHVGPQCVGGGHRTYFVDGGNNLGGDTAQHSGVYNLPGVWMGGWVDGWPVIAGNNATLWLHLASWNLLESQLS